MRVVFVSFYRANDFSEPSRWLERINFYTRILSSLSKHIEVHSINILKYEGMVVKENVNFHFIMSGAGDFQSVNEKIRQLEPSVIIAHGLVYPYRVIRLALKVGKKTPIYLQHHGEPPLKRIKRVWQMIADNFIEGYFFTSRSLARAWVNKKMISAIEKVHEVMEVTSIFSPMQSESLRKEMGLDNNKVYLWVGRLDGNKNPLLMARAFIEFAKHHADVKLFFIFQRNDLLTELNELVNGFADRIKLVGKVDHDKMNKWYNTADFIVSTSYQEGSGVAVTEAMSCGVWPIVTEIPSFVKMTNNGEAGTLFKAGEQMELLDALARSYRMDRVDSKEKVLAFYDANHSADAIAKQIMNALKRAGRGPENVSRSR